MPAPAPSPLQTGWPLSLSVKLPIPASTLQVWKATTFVSPLPLWTKTQPTCTRKHPLAAPHRKREFYNRISPTDRIRPKGKTILS